MDYVIRNNKGVFIRLNSNGKPVTCTKTEKGLFEYSKAKNIVDNLPKTLARLHFIVDAMPEVISKPEMKVIEKKDYSVSDSVKQWIDKFGICDDILKEAKKRKDELHNELSNIDRQFSNLVHQIELEGKVDLYGAWIERNMIKENREKRRMIKDELLIISSVLKMDFKNLDREVINKIVAGLAKRKFTYRIIEEEETENVM